MGKIIKVTIDTFEDYRNNGDKINVNMYKLDDDVIDKNVPDGIISGNYRIWRKNDNKFTPLYVGRSDERKDEGLKERIKDHVDEWEGDLWFDWSEADDVVEAYENECKDYHRCGGDNGKLENNIHPRKPDGCCDLECPICGE